MDERPKLEVQTVLPEEECVVRIYDEAPPVLCKIPACVIGKIEVLSECGKYDGPVWIERDCQGRRVIVDYYVFAVEIRGLLPERKDFDL